MKKENINSINNYMKNESRNGFTLIEFLIIVGAIFLVIGLIIGLGSFFTVDAGERAVVLRFGSVVRSASEGFNLKLPLVERVVRYEVRTQKEQVEATAASKDLQTVKTVVAVNYHLDVDDVSSVYRTLGTEYKTRIIDPAIQEAVKASTANYTAEELITKRGEVKDNIQSKLHERLSQNHVIVSDVSIVDFDFSSSFNAAIEAKVTAEQTALAAKNKLEQVKFEAQQKIETAKADAEAIRIQAQAITSQGGADYVQLQAIKQWRGDVPQYMMSGATVPFINLNK
jgi:regulator of protease activity HflC (stomatin/prohibitin superfamily)